MRVDIFVISTITAVIIAVLYIFMLMKLYRRHVRKLWIPALIVALLSTVLYCYIYVAVGMESPLFLCIFSVTSALKMFIGGINSNSLFVIKDLNCLSLHPQLILTAVSTLFLCSVITTSYFVVYVVCRLGESHIWLWLHRKKAASGIYLLFGTDARSLSLASGLASSGRRPVIILDLPSREYHSNADSLKYIFNLSDDVHNRFNSCELPENVFVLRACRHPKSCVTGDVFAFMGLRRLSDWLRSSDSVVFLLSDDEDENMLCLDGLVRSVETPLTIYCNANRDGLNTRLSMTSSARIRFVDSAFLVEQSLKSATQLAPVNYVDVAVGTAGEKLGYVTSEFHSLVLGFGNDAQAVLKFLYEFGAFPDKNGDKAVFRCDVVQRGIDNLLGEFFFRVPGFADNDEISFHDMSPDSERFHELYAQRLDKLNYVVVTLGGDDDNLRVGLDLLEYAFRYRTSGMKNFAVAVHVEVVSERIQRIVDFYNANYGSVLHLFGSSESIWTVENVFGLSYRKQSMMFYDTYQKASGGTESWMERREALRLRRLNAGVPELSFLQEIERKERQDMSNAWHVHTKASLCSQRLWKDISIPDSIPYVYAGVHSDLKNKSDVAILEMLSICEHLRYEASHIADGYTLAPERDELRKHLENLIPYPELSETIKHYDWLVVKTTLRLLHDKVACM